ncbi:uncharacterized protein N7515_003638, partial [Penicillium bovifimosum]
MTIMEFLRLAAQGTVFFRHRDDDDYVIYGLLYYIHRSLLTELFLAEHALRELTQREERLHHKVIALQKAVAIESDGNSYATHLENAQSQLEMARAQYPRKAHDLFLVEYRFPPEMQHAYHSLRRDPEWFMRKEMIQECSDRGGRGHCTAECECCIGFRGFELSEEVKQEMSKGLQAMLEEETNPVYTIHLASCFFRVHVVGIGIMEFLRLARVAPQGTDFFRVESDNTCLSGRNVYVGRCLLAKLFLAEHALRGLTQREERLHRKVMALQKTVAIECDGRSDATHLENVQQQLQMTREQYPGKAHALFLA